MMKKYIVILSILSGFEGAAAELIFLKDKSHNLYDLDKPEAFLSARALARRRRQKITLTTRDLPISPVYLAVLQQKGAKIIYTSRWLNAVWLEADSVNLHIIKTLEFIITKPWCIGSISKQQVKKRNLSPKWRPKKDYSNQIETLDIDSMHEKGYLGQDIHIAIFDGGFKNIDRTETLNHLFDQKTLEDTFNFIANSQEVFLYDEHGSQILNILATFNSDQLTGVAPLATYSLYVTESMVEEAVFEEFYWLLAAERADSIGVDIISSSLGYNTFDDEADNHTQSDLDGKTTLVSRAATWASQRGILVVNSAGNMEDNWSKVLPPADADSILTVGAVDKNGRLTYFSCLGPTTDQRIKPDVVALGLRVLSLDKNGNLIYSTGTSFAVPFITGLAAGLWQNYPYLTNIQIIKAIKLSGNNPDPNNKIGWGMPSYTRACSLIDKP